MLHVEDGVGREAKHNLYTQGKKCKLIRKCDLEVDMKAILGKAVKDSYW